MNNTIAFAYHDQHRLLSAGEKLEEFHQISIIEQGLSIFN